MSPLHLTTVNPEPTHVGCYYEAKLKLEITNP